jgi:hypothetical protein
MERPESESGAKKTDKNPAWELKPREIWEK